MSYSERARDLLRQAGAGEGDTILVVSKRVESVGVLMPHHGFSAPDVLVLKLKSGYNIGVALEEGSRVEVVSKQAARQKHPRAQPQSGATRKVAVLGTGGTIASYVDYRTGAVHPALSAEDLVSAVPEMAEICKVDAKVLFSIFSEDMSVGHWQAIAAEVADSIHKGDAGCIVPHGTDTMGYTAAALAFMLGDLPCPVVLVGAQRSSDRPSSDAYTNLLSAARFCAEGDAAEVLVLMHDTISDTSAALHRGTRVRKMHSSRRDAFRSMNQGPVARIDFDGQISYLSPYRKRSAGKVGLRPDMEEKVALLQFYPGMNPSIFESVAAGHRGVVIAGTGLGHVSKGMVGSVARAVKGGVVVVMTSQCLEGRVNLNVYDTGRDLLAAGVIPGEDMLPETALVKLMWALANTDGEEGLRRTMQADLRGELSPRREIA